MNESRLQKLIDAKLKTLKVEKDPFIRKRKLQVYLEQKGFEKNLVIRETKDY